MAKTKTKKRPRGFWDSPKGTHYRRLPLSNAEVAAKMRAEDPGWEDTAESVKKARNSKKRKAEKSGLLPSTRDLASPPPESVVQAKEIINRMLSVVGAQAIVQSLRPEQVVEAMIVAYGKSQDDLRQANGRIRDLERTIESMKPALAETPSVRRAMAVSGE